MLSIGGIWLLKATPSSLVISWRNWKSCWAPFGTGALDVSSAGCLFFGVGGNWIEGECCSGLKPWLDLLLFSAFSLICVTLSKDFAFSCLSLQPGHLPKSPHSALFGAFPWLLSSRHRPGTQLASAGIPIANQAGCTPHLSLFFFPFFLSR